MIRRSSRACAGDTSSRSRPTTSRKWAARSVAIVIVERERHDDVGTGRPPEMRRQHADDFERVAVERDRAADDRRIGAEAPPPQRIAEQDDAVAADGFLLGAEIAAERRRHADHAEERRRDLERAHALGLAARRSGCRRPPPDVSVYAAIAENERLSRRQSK